MRFRIRDLLVLTLTAAVAAFAMKSRDDLVRTEVQIAESHANAETLAAEAEMIKQRLAQRDERIAHYRNIVSVGEATVDAFGEFASRYGDLEPQAERVVVRPIPVLNLQPGRSTRLLKVSIPKAYPVVLRAAITEASDGIARRNLDEVEWSRNDPLVAISSQQQCFLNPGMHLIEIATLKSDESSEVQLKVDGQQYSVAGFTQNWNSSGWSSPGGRDAFGFDLKGSTQYLMEIDIEFEDFEAEYHYWFWLSSQADVSGFKQLKPLAVGADENDG